MFCRSCSRSPFGWNGLWPKPQIQTLNWFLKPPINSYIVSSPLAPFWSLWPMWHSNRPSLAMHYMSSLDTINWLVLLWELGEASCTHTESCQVVVDLDDILDWVSSSTDNTVNDVNDSIGGHLVAVDNPGAVHSHNLDITFFFFLNCSKSKLQSKFPWWHCLMTLTPLE